MPNLEFLKKSIDDRRAISDIGCAIFMKQTSGNASGYYTLFMPLTGIPAMGSAPDAIETTVTTSRRKSYIQGRKDTPQLELTAHGHRDNFTKAQAVKNTLRDFLVVYSDGTGIKFSGTVDSYTDAVELGGIVPLKVTMTVNYCDDDYTLNVYDLLKDTVIFTNSYEHTYTLATTTGTKAIEFATDPSTATLTATSSASSVATVAVSSKTVTVTGVATGTTVITVSATDTGIAGNSTSFVVFVPSA